MMKMNGINGVNAQTEQPGLNQVIDSYGRNLQNQIAYAQKQLQELSSNEKMSIEEKMKKRQEIQQQINDLNIRLRQHQIELRKEKQQAKNSSVEDMLGGSKNSGSTKTGNQETGLSQASMKAMMSADAAIGQARMQGSVATKMKGRAGILKSEIKLDAALGGDTKAKEEELAEVEQMAMNATASQMSTLGKANKELEEAVKADGETDKAVEAEEDKEAAASDEKIAGNKDSKSEQADAGTQYDLTDKQPIIYYTSVDVRL